MGTPAANRALTVKVGRRNGNFAEIPAPTSVAGLTIRSPGGGFRIRTLLGSQAGSSHAFVAVIETAAGQNRGTSGFYTGGPAICAGDAAGVVLTSVRASGRT